MFYIDDTELHIAGAKTIHYERIKCFIGRRMDQTYDCMDHTCKICTSRMEEAPGVDQQIKDFFTSANIDTLLTGKPRELYDLNEVFWLLFFPGFTITSWAVYYDKKLTAPRSTSLLRPRAQEVQDIVKQLMKIIDYDWFIKKDHHFYNAYDLAKALDRNTCTYCNRIYTATVIKTDPDHKIVRPSFDHWFPKVEFPLLAMSFYNLVPACTNCNSSVKGSEPFNLDDHVHPYVNEKQTDEFAFDYSLSSASKPYRIYVKKTVYNKDKAVKTLEGMYINEVYSSHQSELEDLLKIKKNYSNAYLKNIQALTKGKLNAKEVYRLLFGVAYDVKDFHKLPLSKFKFDILKRLKMLDDITKGLKS
jgi:hypothetical protein